MESHFEFHRNRFNLPVQNQVTQEYSLCYRLLNFELGAAPVFLIKIVILYDFSRAGCFMTI